MLKNIMSGVFVVLIVLCIIKKGNKTSKEAQKRCKHCGENISIYASVCPHCGQKVGTFGSFKEEFRYMMSGSIGIFVLFFLLLVGITLVYAFLTGSL